MASKKDYEAFAAILRREHEKLVHGPVREPMLALTILTNKIMGYFQSDNPNFDWDRFARAARCDDDPQPLDTDECYCVECLRGVDQETFEWYDGHCSTCAAIAEAKAQRDFGALLPELTAYLKAVENIPTLDEMPELKMLATQYARMRNK